MITSLDALIALNQNQKDSPDTKHINYLDHMHQVELVNNVYNGIDSVVAAGYLFQFPQETIETYNTRADRATLRNFVKRAVEAFTGEHPGRVLSSAGCRFRGLLLGGARAGGAGCAGAGCDCHGRQAGDLQERTAIDR